MPSFSYKIPKSNKQEYYKLSAAQKRMYFQQQIEKNNTSYNNSLKYLVKGDLDILKLEQCINKIIQRHEILRTSFLVIQDQVIQYISSEVKIKIAYVEYSKEDWNNLFYKFIQPFDLSECPLFRVMVIKKGEKEYVLCCDFHHIISDYVSIRIFFNELSALYNNKALQEVKFQYRDFSEWQNKIFSLGKYSEQETYWLNKFKASIPELKLPFDFNNDKYYSQNTSELITFFIEGKEKIQKTAYLNHTSPFIYLLAVFNVLMFHYTGQNDIIIGTAINGRNYIDTQNIMGMFINMLAIRNFIDANQSFVDFLKSVSNNCLEAYSNQDYPIDELIRKINIHNKHNIRQLFNTEFAMIANEIEKIDLNGLSCNLMDEDMKFAKFDLHFQLINTSSSLKIIIRYSTKRFLKDTIKNLKNHFQETISQVLNNPELKLKDIRLSHNYVIADNDLIPDDNDEFNI